MPRSAESRSPDVAPALIAAIGELAPIVAEHRREFDANGRLPDDLFEHIASLGLFRLLLPATLGGPGLSALEFMDVVEAAAALDGTIGWLVGNGGGMARVGDCSRRRAPWRSTTIRWRSWSRPRVPSVAPFALRAAIA